MRVIIVLSEFAETAIMLVMLTAVEADFLTLLGDTHGYELIGQPIESVGDGGGVDEDDGEGDDVIDEELCVRDALLSERRLILVDEDASEERPDYATEAVSRENIEGVVDGGALLPAAGAVADDGCD